MTARPISVLAAGLLALGPARASAVSSLEESSHPGPRVYIQLERPEPDKGVVKLARYDNTVSQPVASGQLITTYYEELCTDPCGMTVDTSERPIFFFVRDGQPISPGFRLHEFAGQTVTVKVRAQRSGMLITGAVLTGLFLLPVGIPLWIAGRPIAWVAPGRVGRDDPGFRRLKKARL